jgi:hypothetical protein
MAAGSVVAHALSYPLVAVRAEGAGQEGAERSSSGLAAHSVLPLGMVAALVGAAGLGWLFALARGRSGRGVSPWLFFVLPPLAFGFQELGERLLNVEAAPFQAVLEPRFLFGLALQVPFGLVALLVAQLFLRVVERIARVFGRGRPLAVATRRPPLAILPAACQLPRIPALALGYPQRGPPLR